MLRTLTRELLQRGAPPPSSWRPLNTNLNGTLRRNYTLPSQPSTRQAISRSRLQSPRSTATTTTTTTTSSQSLKQHPFRRAPRRNFNNSSRLRDSKSNPASSSSSSGGGGSESKSAAPAPGLKERLKRLSKEYGWTAVGVYLALSALDFPFCYLLVRLVGTERVGEIEHYVTERASAVTPQAVKDAWATLRSALRREEEAATGGDRISEGVGMAGWGVRKADEEHRAEASLGTQLALAYAVHKSFIFVRVPLTAAILPRVVKVLRSWGWKVGKAAS